MMRLKHWRSEVVVVRYADDFVIGFEHQDEAKRCLDDLHERFDKFGLKLHEGKTRLIEFGRYAIERRQRRKEDRPDTFDFLGFTHKCAQTKKNGWFTIHRHSTAKRMRTTLQAIKAELRKRMHRPIGETGRWLRRVGRKRCQGEKGVRNLLGGVYIYTTPQSKWLTQKFQTAESAEGRRGRNQRLCALRDLGG